MSEQQKTVKVRVAVVVDGDGVWNSCGWSSVQDDDAMCNALESISGVGESCYWLEAELPIPQVETVAADVEEAASDE